MKETLAHKPHDPRYALFTCVTDLVSSDLWLQIPISALD